ncbi:prolyl oligopeptidase family serine peptidase [Paractinoplanes ferrugineus]|uniref:Peptidase n=1 Tax=Paractinoplanes ferrugineus TaxID=113564 RepID=A0A919IWQ9_9ACTN|nr:prolyl oligopeptidase family serine peptidase [Actinoplanes ferrugineus]GIE08713.1 peptidase [Actinoplanes ferrugineus]
MDYPGLAGRTGHFSYGAPRDVTVGGDGSRVTFLRSAGPEDPYPALWLLNVPLASEIKIAEGPIDAYAVDRDARVAAFARDGRLFRADLIDGTVTEVATDEPVSDPRPDPIGRNIGYVTPGGSAALRVVGPGGDRLMAGEPGTAWREHGGLISWGVPDPAAVQFGRRRGWWWSPDGNQILAARTAAATSLHLLDLNEGWVDVHWDRETYPYVVNVRWAEGGGPLITVLRRLQQHGLVLAIDPRTGETQVHAELADARWVEPVDGTPRHLPDGRVLVGGELAHDGFDARCLFADGSLLTPPGLYVRQVIGTLPRQGTPSGAPDLVVVGTDGDPATQSVFRVRTSLGGGGGAEARKISLTPGWHRAVAGGDVLVVDDTVWRGEARVATLGNFAAPLPYHPRPTFERVTDRRLPAAVLYPAGFVGGSKIPVLVTLGDGPGHQQVISDPAAWQERQWWADSGFAVVSVDSRGTPGVAPSFEKVVHRRLVDVALTDHADALHVLLGKHPDLDLSSVSVLGSGLGGWLAAMAVLRRPEVFHRAVARRPVTDWAELPAPFAERYLGDRLDVADVYAHHSLLEAAAQSDRDRPLLLVGATLPGFDSVPAATLDEELAFLRTAGTQ